MGMVAILVKWPGPFEQTFVPPSHRSSIWNLTLTGPVVSEEKMFKECGRRWRMTTDDYLSYKLTKWACASGELKILYHRVFILIQPGNQAVFTPSQAGLTSDKKKYHSFSFCDRNKYKPLANDNPKQYLESWIYDPNKYQKMWKHNPYLRHIPIYLYIGSDPTRGWPKRAEWKMILFFLSVW